MPNQHPSPLHIVDYLPLTDYRECCDCKHAFNVLYAMPRTLQLEWRCQECHKYRLGTTSYCSWCDHHLVKRGAIFLLHSVRWGGLPFCQVCVNSVPLNGVPAVITINALEPQTLSEYMTSRRGGNINTAEPSLAAALEAGKIAFETPA